MSAPLYRLKLHIESDKIEGEFIYTSPFPASNIFLLNRAFKLNVSECAHNVYENPIKGTNYNVKVVEITEKDFKEIKITYNGAILKPGGIAPYAREEIKHDFVLVRWETFLFPIPSKPALQDLIHSLDQKYTVEIEVLGRSGLVIASPIPLREEGKQNHLSYFYLKAKDPINLSAISFVMSNYKRIEGKTVIFFVREKNIEKAKSILNELASVHRFYSSNFGRWEPEKKVNIAEIEKGLGSFVPIKGFIYLDESALDFSFSNRFLLFHEYAHLGWDLKGKGVDGRSRFFDEAFAQYLALRAIEEFYGKDAMMKLLIKLRENYITSTNETGKVVPIEEYGKYEMGELSYTAGAWALMILRSSMGTSQFEERLRAFIEKFRDREADFTQFKKFFSDARNVNFEKFWRDWFQSTLYDSLLKSESTLQEIASVYIM